MTNEYNNKANSSFSSTYREDNTNRYLKHMSLDKAGTRNLWNEISNGRRDHEQYKMIAYTNDMSCRYSIQFQNNMMVPVYLHNSLGLHLSGFRQVEDLSDPVVMFVETYTISDSMQLKDLVEYYKNTPLLISDSKEENIVAGQDMITMLSRDSFPAIIRVSHIVKLNNYKHERRIYVPSLNVMLYKTGKDLRYAGEHPRASEITNRFDVSPKNSLGDRNLYQHFFKIINNEEPGRKYYLKLFNRVVEIESTPSMLAVENSCIKMAYFQEKRLIEEVIKEGLSDENLKAMGIYKTRIEAENTHDINKIIEKVKLDIELSKLNLNSSDMVLKASLSKNSLETGRKKLDLESRKLDLEFDKLEIDKSKLVLDKEKLELEFNKLYKDIKLIERGYRNEIGKLNIGLIKETTDAISVVIRLASLIKSFFSKE